MRREEADAMAIRAVNPATGRTIEEFAEWSEDRIERAVEGAHRAARAWRDVSFAERARPMREAARILRARTDDLARIMALEMGKILREGRAEVAKCAWVCEHYAEHAESMLVDEAVETDAGRSFVTYRPLGVVLAVMPWNFPLWQVFRFAAPALMAGNAGVLKHASNVPRCALEIEAVFREAGFPEGLFATLLVGSARVPAILDDPRIRAATLTGSTPAGRAVAERAGRRLKKTVLELGGSDPYVILEDADLESAAATCGAARLLNAGQSCIAAKRFIVVEAVRDRFEAGLVDAMGRKRMGDPSDESSDLGPMARRDLRDELHDQVRRSLAQGARLALGGSIPEGPGAYYPPTVLLDVGPGMPAYAEELFGPVAAVIPARDETDAIRIANDTPFGLGAAVFTREVARGERIAVHELEAGCCFVNDFVRSDPRLPFGGVKESGYGRELGTLGIREFVNAKAVWVK